MTRTSKHYITDRQKRENIIKKIGMGNVVDSFIINRGHKEGAERHEITSTGIIIIYNNRTNMIVTKLIARPGQIRRYYEEGKAPKNLIEKAIDNTVKNHYNRVQKERKRKMKKKIIIGFIPLFIANLVLYGVTGCMEYVKDTKEEWKRG